MLLGKLRAQPSYKDLLWELRIQSNSNFQDWFGDMHHIEIKKNIVKLGRYCVALTIMPCISYLRSQTREREEEHILLTIGRQNLSVRDSKSRGMLADRNPILLTFPSKLFG